MAREQGLWNLFLPPSRRSRQQGLGSGPDQRRVRPALRDWADRTWHLRSSTVRPRHRQHGGVTALRNARQQDRWLRPLLDGTCAVPSMTEPEVGSSDATNIASTIVLTVTVTCSTAASGTRPVRPTRAEILIFMGRSDPENPDRHRRQSMILVRSRPRACGWCGRCRCRLTACRTAPPRSSSRH